MRYFIKNQKVKCRMTMITLGLTEGKEYIIHRVGHTFVRVKNDLGLEIKIKHKDSPIVFDYVPYTFNDSLIKDLYNRRITQPRCTCGAWSVKDSGHVSWCDLYV